MIKHNRILFATIEKDVEKKIPGVKAVIGVDKMFK